MNRIIADIIYSVIIGDATGYTFNGMKKPHIKAVFKDITGYTDPAPALKNNMQRWKKPGLYSSISQNMLITAACIDKRGLNLDGLINAVKDSPKVSGVEYGIFRDPGEAEKNFIYRIKNGENSGHHYNNPCSRLLPPIMSLLLINNEKEQLISAVKYISLFTKSSSNIACSILLLQIIKDLIAEKDRKILETALLSAEKARSDIIANQDRIFDSGLNPDYIVTESESMLELFKELNGTKNSAEYEKIICRHADKKKTDTITRGSVNLPETILPMAVILSDLCSVPEQIFYTAAVEGGSASSLTSISGAISAAFYGANIPEILAETLVNKKRITGIIDLIADDRSRSSIIKEMFDTEPGLTAKEFEEYRAKNRNLPAAKEKKNKSRGDIESGLTKHVVESWTKLDKAKWKKDRKKG